MERRMMKTKFLMTTAALLTGVAVGQHRACAKEQAAVA